MAASQVRSRLQMMVTLWGSFGVASMLMTCSIAWIAPGRSLSGFQAVGMCALAHERMTLLCSPLTG